jgi:hypothetical protein
MFTVSENFGKAVPDYLYLQERQYPQKSSLKLVGDKFQLSRTERSMLYRGVVTSCQKKLRENKIIDQLPESPVLHVDGYNVIRTIGSYLLGKVVFISMDGILRDASEMHRSTLRKQILDRTLQLLIDYLKEIKPVKINIYLDEPVSKSGELAKQLNQLLNNNRLTGKAITTHSPDYHLKQADSGIICTADSAVIENCSLNIFDLPQAILSLHFNPDFINLQINLSELKNLE